MVADPIGDRLLKLFRHQCLGLTKHCTQRAVCVHEIDPKSLCWEWNVPTNRVALCAMCHTWTHNVGTHRAAYKIKYLLPVLMRQLDISKEDVEICYQDNTQE